MSSVTPFRPSMPVVIRPPVRVQEQTLLTAQQDDGDQWVEVGIIQNDGPGLRGVVVAHDTDDGSAKKIYDIPVTGSRRGFSTVYADAFDTFQLVVSGRGRREEADFSLIMDGPYSMQREGLFVYRDSEISYDL